MAGRSERDDDRTSAATLVSTIGAGLRLCWQAAPRLLVATSILQVVSGLAMVAVVFLGGRLVDQLVEPQVATSTGELVAFVCLSGLGLGASLAKGEYASVLGERVERLAVDQVLDSTVHADLASYEAPAFHDLLVRALDAAEFRPTQLSNALLGLVSTTTTIVGLGVALVTLSPTLLLLVLAGIVPLGLAARAATVRIYAFIVRQAERDRRRDYFLWTLAARSHAAEIRAFDIGTHLRRQVDRLHGERIDDLTRLARARTLLGLVGVVVSVTVGGFVFYSVDRQVSDGRLGLDEATIVAGALLVMAQRLQALTHSASTVHESTLFLQDLAKFERIADRRSAEPLPSIERLGLRGVTFTYPAGDSPAIRDLDLELRRGELVALVGENGSGKTTLAKLLSLLYRPELGTVTINGQPVGPTPPADHGRSIAVVNQDHLRLLTTATEAVALGDIEAADDRERIRAAARFAGVDAAIERLPDGYDTLLGTEFSDGMEISGGQWQRLAIARAWFRDAEVLILDEPTSALDPVVEIELIDRIREHASDKIVVLISHRFGTVASADRILVMNEGRITEDGTHAELLAAAEVYATLYSVQAGQFERARIEP